MAVRTLRSGVLPVRHQVLRGDAGTGGLLADCMRSLMVRAGEVTLAVAPGAFGISRSLLAVRALGRCRREAHFSRAFGLTPGDVRAGVRIDRVPTTAAADSSGARAYEGWLRGLRRG